MSKEWFRNSICTVEWGCFNLECIRECTSAYAAQFRIFSPCNTCKRDTTLPKATRPDHVVTIWETQTQFLRIFELSLAPTRGLPGPSQCSPFRQKHLEPFVMPQKNVGSALQLSQQLEVLGIPLFGNVFFSKWSSFTMPHSLRLWCLDTSINLKPKMCGQARGWWILLTDKILH